jgi:outer membrane lipoprotein LolB
LIRLLIFLPLLALLTGCAPFQAKTVRPLPSGDVRQALYELKSWRMEGRIGVQTSEDAWQANLFWEHEPAQDRLRVSGPLSQGMVSIVVQKDLIYINEGNGITHASRDPDAMLQERLGFAVPLASLRYWMLGVPDPEQTSTPLPAGEGFLSGFEQAGWVIRVERSRDIENLMLPQKLLVQGRGVKLKIIGDNWEIKG